MFTPNDILEIAKKIEKNGEKLYKAAAKSTSNKELSSFLNWAADEEAQHFNFFMKLREEKIRETQYDEIEAIGITLIENAIGTHTFSLDKEELVNSDCLDQIISKSIQMEEDTILFYELLATLVNDEDTKIQLEQIIKEEEKHKMLLQEFSKVDIY